MSLKRSFKATHIDDGFEVSVTQRHIGIDVRWHEFESSQD
jgi:hypothetical protein